MSSIQKKFFPGFPALRNLGFRERMTFQVFTIFPKEFPHFAEVQSKSATKKESTTAPISLRKKNPNYSFPFLSRSQKNYPKVFLPNTKVRFRSTALSSILKIRKKYKESAKRIIDGPWEEFYSNFQNRLFLKKEERNSTEIFLFFHYNSKKQFRNIRNGFQIGVK